jgi:hypothetical protein
LRITSSSMPTPSSRTPRGTRVDHSGSAACEGQAQIKQTADTPLPRDFFVSGVLQRMSGSPVEPAYTASNADIAPSLGRKVDLGARCSIYASQESSNAAAF